MNQRLLRFVLVTAWTSALGCTGQGIANFELSLPELPKENFEIRLRIEERAEPKQPGPIVASAAPIGLAPDQSSLELPRLEVPHGDRRVAIVEIARPGAERVVYYGLSEPFSLAAGEEITVAVQVEFVEPPDGSVRIATARFGYVRSPEVDLILRLDTAERVRVSNIVSFPAETSMEVGLDELAGVGDEHRLPWSLDTGLDLPCGASDYCLRQVFVRLIDEFGYEAPSRTSTVVVDTLAPSVRSVPTPALSFESSWDARRTLERAGPLTRSVRVSFAMSEPTYAPPVLSAVGPDTLAFEPCEGTALIYCTLLIDPNDPPPEGEYAIVASAEDLAGNSADAMPVAEFSLDSTPPSPPDTRSIVYRRTPWGSRETGGASQFFVDVGTSALPAGATAIVIDRSDYDDPNTQVLGHLGSPSTNSARIELTRADRERVYLIAVDDAGNRSEARLIEQVEWVATAGSARPRSDLNPHLIERVPRFEDRLLVQDSSAIFATTATGAARVAIPDGLSLIASGASVWKQRQRSGAPNEARWNHAMAFDRARGLLVVFGGADATGPFVAKTLEWDGDRWTRPILTSAEPPPRTEAAMVYHAAIGRSLLFGGFGAGVFGDTWTFDGSAWENVPGRGPDARGLAAMAYDSRRGRAVMFGGEGPNTLTPFGDTWEFDGLHWTQVLVQGPPPRRDTAMAYDARRDRIVLFGGHDGQITSPWGLSDTWEYSESGWTEISNPAPPPARAYHAMVFDEEREAVILYGGSQDETLFLSDAWEWVEVDGQMRWRAISDVSLGARGDHAMAYSTMLDHAVLFGGHVALDVPTGDLTLLGEAEAVDVTPRGISPPPRFDAAIAYDAARNEVMLFGGQYNDTDWLTDTWIWNGRGWEERTGTTPGPMLAWPTLVEQNGALHVVGTDLGTSAVQVWQWSGSDWIPLLSMGSEPTPRLFPAAASDPSTGDILLFGGFFVDLDENVIFPQDFYAWNGSEWRELAGGSEFPPGRIEHSFASDDRGRVVLYGGLDAKFFPLDDLWEWDGVAEQWSRRAPGPDARFEHAAVLDPIRSRLAMWGGAGVNELPPEVWERSGALDRWEVVPLAGFQPPPRAAHQLVYQPVSQRLVAFGGCPGAVPCPFSALADTWELSRDPAERPALHVGFSAASAPIERDRIEQIRIDIVAGGRGYTTILGGTGVAEDGARMLAWDAYTGAWIELASAPHSSESPGDITFTTTSSQAAQRLLAADGFVHVAILPAAGRGNGPSAPEIAADGAEIHIDFRQE